MAITEELALMASNVYANSNIVVDLVNIIPFARIRRINDACLKPEPFKKAMPQNQPDAE